MSDIGDKTLVVRKMRFSINDAILLDVQSIELIFNQLQPTLPWIIP
jgi:hypothetical protein